MSDLPISPELLVRLQEQAQRAGLSVDAYLTEVLAVQQQPSDVIPPIHQHVFDLFADAVLMCNTDGYFIYSNQFALNQLGYSAAEMRQLTPEAIVHPAYLDSARKHLQQLWAGETVIAEYEYCTKKGDTIAIEVNARRVDYRGNRVIIAVLRDIRERKRIELALQESEARYRTLVEALPIGVSAIQNDSFIYTNPAGARILGYPSPVDLIGRKVSQHLTERVVSDYVPMAQQRIDHLLENKDNPVIEMAIRRPDGTVITTESSSLPIVYNGKPAGLIIGRDITERKQAEVALRQSETRLRSLIESQTCFVIRTDTDGNYTYINDAFFNRFCFAYNSINELIGTSSLRTILPDDHPKAIDTVMRCIQEPGKAIQVILRKPRPDGNVFQTLWEFVALTNSAGEFYEMQCMGIDITALLKAEDQSHLQENALQAAANAIVITNNKGVIEWTNAAFTTLTGYTQEEAIGKTPNVLKSGKHDSAFYAALWNRVSSGQVWQGRMINRRKDGDLYAEEMTITPVQDRNGVITHFIAIKQNISEREEAEQLRLEQERLKATLKKEEEFSELVRKTVSALSHDVRTPLAVIDAVRETLDQYYDRLDDTKRREKLDIIGKQLHFVLGLVDDLTLTMKNGLGQSVFNPTAVNMPALCQVIVNEIYQTSSGSHNFHFVSDGRIRTVWLDETLVNRILINLMANAVKFSAAGSSVQLVLSQDGDWVRLQVIDEGRGIHPEDLPHIFEPFYRSKSVRDTTGTGLGLNIVKECVDRHAGRIEVTSKPGIGTTFTVMLPLRQQFPSPND